MVTAIRPSSTRLVVSSSRPEPGAVVLHVAGEVDAVTAPELAGALAPLWATAPGAPGLVVLDLSEVGFLGTAGLFELAHAAERAEADQVTLRLVGGPRCVERALEVAGLSSRLPVSAHLEQALRR